MSENFKDYFSTKSAAYANYRPKYPRELAEELAKLCDETHRSLDCGCGSGQFSVLLADFFDEVIATDASSNQIENAEQHPNIIYKVSPAEQIPLPDNSVDIITVAQAVHWFDLDKFYVEAKRVLKPNGMIALITYQNIVTKDSACKDIIDNFYGKTLDLYWPPERKIVESGYKTLAFPFQEIEFPNMQINARWNFHQVYGYITTWSAYKALEADAGATKINTFEEALKNAWGDLETEREIYWPMSFRVGQFHE